MHRKLHFRDVSQVDESEQTKTHVTADPSHFGEPEDLLL
jgi:hypothetical protein